MITIGMSFAAAVTLGAGAVLSKRLTTSMPARQLVGPLLLLNALLVAPAAIAGGWIVRPQTLLLHAIEALLLVTGSLAIWDLYDSGAASAAITAQSLSPLPTVLAVAVFLPAAFGFLDALGAAIVVGGVVFALSNAFPRLGCQRRLATVTLAATCAGVLTVTSRLLADLGVGIVATYLSRTLLAAVFVMIVIPPREVPLRQLPRLVVRAAVVTLHFLFVLTAVRTGSPAVVQTVVATGPLIALGYEAIEHRRSPSLRILSGTAAVAIGVGVISLG